MNNDDQQTSSSSPSEIEDREHKEQVCKRRTSIVIDALDLHIVKSNQVKRKVSQIGNLRHKFLEYQHRKPECGKPSTCSACSAADRSVEGPKKRKVSQIDVFRSKFLAYYGGKTEGPGVLDSLSENVKPNRHNGKNERRKKSAPVRTPSFELSSDGEELPRFSSSPPSYLRDNNNNNNENTSQQSVENEHKGNDSVPKTSQTSRLSLASVLQHSKLITVTLNRKPGEGWGIELVHVTKTGSSMSQNDSSANDEEKVVYVQHNGNGINSIMNTSCAGDISNELSGTSTPHSASSSSGSSEHEIATILGTLPRPSADVDRPIEDMRHIVHKQNLRRRIGSHLAPSDASPISSRPASACAAHLRPINPLPPRPSSALAQWRKEGSPQPRPGVRVVALTEGGVAEKNNELAVDDLIVEVSKLSANLFVSSGK